MLEPIDVLTVRRNAGGTLREAARSVRAQVHAVVKGRMDTRKRIALVAHEKKKQDLLDWVLFNREKLSRHSFWSSGNTGKLIQESCPDLEVTRLKSGPLGGDQQVGAMIAEGRLDMLIFFIDPLSPQPHDVDVKALTRLSTLYDIPFAHNRSTADFVISSPLFEQAYERSTSDPQAEFDRLLGTH